MATGGDGRMSAVVRWSEPNKCQAETEDGQMVEFSAVHFEPSQQLLGRDDLRLYVHPGDTVELEYDSSGELSAVRQFPSPTPSDCDRDDGVVDKLAGDFGNIWSRQWGNVGFVRERLTLLGDRVTFKRKCNLAGNLVAYRLDTREHFNPETWQKPSSTNQPTASTSSQSQPVQTVVETAIRETPNLHCSAQDPIPTTAQIRPNPAEPNGLSPGVSPSVAAKKPPIAQDSIDLIFDGMLSSARSEHSDVGMVTSVYSVDGRILCPSGELVKFGIVDFLQRPTRPLYELLSPFQVVRFRYEKFFNHRKQKFVNRIFYLELVDEDFPHWNLLKVSKAVVLGHFSGTMSDHFSGAYLRCEDLPHGVMMPQYAWRYPGEDLKNLLPIGTNLTVVIVEGTRQYRYSRRCPYWAVLNLSNFPLWNCYANLPFNLQSFSNEFLRSRPHYDEIWPSAVLIDRPVGEAIEPQRPATTWLRPFPPEDISEPKIGLVTTVYKKWCRVWLPPGMALSGHIDSLSNVSASFMGDLIRPFQVVKVQTEQTRRQPAAIQPTTENFPHWDLLTVCKAKVIQHLFTRPADANRPHFSGVVLKSDHFPQQILMPDYAYPLQVEDLTGVLPLNSHLRVVVTKNMCRSDTKFRHPLMVICCLPRHVDSRHELIQLVKDQMERPTGTNGRHEM